MFELSEAQQAVQTSIRRFARRELRWRARKLDNAPPGAVDWDLLRKSCAFGLLSGQLPPAYGGTMDPLSAVIAAEEIAHWDAGTATLLAANSLAQAAIALSGNTTVMDQVFPAITTGETQQEPIFVALALTERRLGSDLVHPMPTNTTRMMVLAKRRGNAYVLSGRKAYCAGGNLAQWICVFATLSEDRSPAGLTGFVVPTTASGFHVSEILPTMGLRACPLVEFYLENVTVPAAHLLTAEGQAHALVQALSARGRYQGAAIALGIARGAFELARQHSIARTQGGGPIASHQMVQHLLADMATQIEAARLLTYKAATTTPADLALSSMAKVFASDMAVRVATDAVQIMGAYGTTLKAGAEKYFRDAKMTQIFAGTNEICRLAITAPMLRDAGLLPVPERVPH
jgi:alkylation response protein AidB-like acyl-CoA dehydrogenase